MTLQIRSSSVASDNALVCEVWKKRRICQYSFAVCVSHGVLVYFTSPCSYARTIVSRKAVEYGRILLPSCCLCLPHSRTGPKWNPLSFKSSSSKIRSDTEGPWRNSSRTKRSAVSQSSRSCPGSSQRCWYSSKALRDARRYHSSSLVRCRAVKDSARRFCRCDAIAIPPSCENITKVDSEFCDCPETRSRVTISRRSILLRVTFFSSF